MSFWAWRASSLMAELFTTCDMVKPIRAAMGSRMTATIIITSFCNKYLAWSLMYSPCGSSKEQINEWIYLWWLTKTDPKTLNVIFYSAQNRSTYTLYSLITSAKFSCKKGSPSSVVTLFDICWLVRGSLFIEFGVPERFGERVEGRPWHFYDK